MTIKQILDSESNKETEDDKFNRVDILVENSKDELLIIEVQNSNDKDAKEYKKYLKRLRDIASEQHTKMADAQDLINKGKEERDIEIVMRLHSKDKTPDEISDLTGLQAGRVIEIIERQRSK